MLETDALSSDSLLAFAYLVGPGSLLAYSVFVWLLEHESISTVSTYTYVNPVVAIVLGWALLSGAVTPAVAAGAFAIVLSVALVLRTEPSEARRGPAPGRGAVLRRRPDRLLDRQRLRSRS
jgi:drug/metabolite transporter (DMT)-like permease